MTVTPEIISSEVEENPDVEKVEEGHEDFPRKETCAISDSASDTALALSNFEK
jgi:hypothetical protein